MKMRMFMAVLLSSATIFILLVVVGGTTQAEGTQQLPTILHSNNSARTSFKPINLRDATTITFTQVSTVYLPLVANAYPWPVYSWLSQQQDATTGLLPSQQDQAANTYNNALAVMVFTLKGDYTKASRILAHFKNGASEFFAGRCASFDSACSATDLCDGTHPCGFFQLRNSKTGIFDPASDRWIGDMSWLAMAVRHYEVATGDMSYASMATATIRLLKNFQQADGHIASGWMQGNQVFTTTGASEGNLDAYKALSLFGEDRAAQRVKDWLDYHDMGSQVWEEGPLDLHVWRVLALGKEYGYVLPDVTRADNATLHYLSTITINNSLVSGFLPSPAYCPPAENIWAEGTGGMAVAFYKAGYREQGDFYVGQLKKLLFEPVAFPGTQTLSFYARLSPCATWADPTKGHVASVSWYIFAQEHFDPFDGVVMNSFQIANPVVKREAESYSNSSGGVRLDGAGVLFEGRGIHIGGDDNTSGNNSGWVEYKFNVLVPLSITAISMRYADDVAGDTGTFVLDGSFITSFNTIDTGTWNNYTVTDFLIGSQLQPGLHTLRLEVTDNGTYGFTPDYFQLDIPALSGRK